MQMPWQNPKNPNIDPENFQVTPQFTPVQKIITALFVIVLFPVALVLYPIGLLLWGAFKMAGFVGFYLAGVLFNGKNKTRVYSGQWIRSWLSREAASLPHINSLFRNMLYRLSGIRVGKKCFIGMGGILEDLFPERVIIEDNVSMSFGVTVISHGPSKSIGKPTVFRHHAYIGARSTFLPGVEVGQYAVVGAGSVVTKDVPPGAVVAGNPARVLRYTRGYKAPETEQKE